MQFLDYLVIIIFTLGILIAGLSFGRTKADMRSFFAAGGAVPWPINGLSLFMSFFSAGTFVVWGSIAYEHGWVAVTIQWAMCLAAIFIGMFIAPAWRKAGILTVAEFIEKRLGHKVQKFYSYVFLFIALFYTGQFLYPVARIVNVSIEIPITHSIWILGIMVILYTAVGGLWAVVVTDVLQFVILTAAVLIVLPLALKNVGGMQVFIEESPEGFFSFFSAEYSPWFIAAFMAYNLVFIGGNWAYVQRYTSVRDALSAKKVAFLFAALYVVSPVLWMLPPMLYRILQPELSGLENEGAYLLMCKEVLPAGLLGLMLGGMIFATASSVNTTLNMSAAVFTNDIFKQLRPKSGNALLMIIARISTILFGLGAIGVALMVPSFGGIVEMVLSVGAITGAALYLPPVWCLFSKHQTGNSVIAITLISLIINSFFKFVSPSLLGISLNRGMELIAGVGIPAVLLLSYELYGFLRSAIDEKYLQYSAASHISSEVSQQDEDASKRQNRYGIKVISIALGGTGLMIFMLGLMAEDAVVLISGMGMGIMVLAFWLKKRWVDRA
jgi:solute:Na+ symporter, SSS family